MISVFAVTILTRQQREPSFDSGLVGGGSVSTHFDMDEAVVVIAAA